MHRLITIILCLLLTSSVSAESVDPFLENEHFQVRFDCSACNSPADFGFFGAGVLLHSNVALLGPPTRARISNQETGQTAEIQIKNKLSVSIKPPFLGLDVEINTRVTQGINGPVLATLDGIEVSWSDLGEIYKLHVQSNPGDDPSNLSGDGGNGSNGADEEYGDDDDDAIEDGETCGGGGSNAWGDEEEDFDDC